MQASTATILPSLLAALTLFALPSGARGQVQTTPLFTTLHSFGNDGADGQYPQDGLVQGNDGNLYGTTNGGGDTGSGTVFSVQPDGTFTVLHAFSALDDHGANADGAYPEGTLVQGSDGNFYGTATGGGGNGLGTVFSLTPAGAFTTLHSFNSADGTSPATALVQGGDGSFYGTTSTDGGNGSGTVFSIRPDGTFAVLHDFSTLDGNHLNADGANPAAALIQGGDGNLYGTTARGGSGGTGTVFSMTPTGIFTTLHSFRAADSNHVNADGANPTAALVQGGDGSFYGTAGGGSNGSGTVFSIRPDGTFATLYSFGVLENHPSTNADGARPRTRRSLTNRGIVEGPFINADGDYPNTLVRGTDGSFYGTTRRGGGNGYGTVFSLSPAGGLTVLHTFSTLDDAHHNADGAEPEAGLVQGADGSFYGTTEGGGTDGSGAVFRLTLPSPGTLQFAAGSVDTNENAGNVTLTVSRVGGGAGAVTVDYATADGSAVAGMDYTATGGTLSWADGDTADQTITIPVLDRGLYDGSTRTFTVSLGNATGGTAVGTPATANVNILDNDSPPTPPTPTPTVVSVAVGGDGLAVAGGEKGMVFVLRTGDTSQPLTVAYKARGTAVAGVDYKALTGTVTIPAGAAKLKLKVKALAGSPDPGVRKLKLKLLAPGDGSYTVGGTMATLKLVEQ